MVAALSALGHQALADDEADERGHVSHLRLGNNVLAVRLSRALAGEELVGNPLVRVAFGDELQDPGFALREVAQLPGFANSVR